MNSATQPPNRIIDMAEGTAMVVTDLHGDWDAYVRYRDKFLALKAQGTADFLMILGDMIHRSGPESTDQSLEIVLDLIRLRNELDDRLVCLLGNHEMPHIYSITLRKGDELYTPRFERALGQHRQTVIGFFNELPFLIRTASGVTLCHAGGTATVSEKGGLEKLRTFSHEALLARSRALVTPEDRPSLMRKMRQMHNRSYNEMARTYLAVTGIDDPRYDDFLIGTLATNEAEFNFLWNTLFSRNEHEYGKRGYRTVLLEMLKALSNDFSPQSVVVSGHIDVQGGYELIHERQLRLASAKHAFPREAGRYLLLDMAKPVTAAADLLPYLDSVFN